MQIIDLDPAHEPLYFVCLEDWSGEMDEAGDHKQAWYRCMKEKGLRVKLALDDSGKAVGMIETLPIEVSIAQGSGLFYVNCIWVHGHPQGVGDQRKRGYGKALLAAAEDDAKAAGAKGMAAHAMALPFWIPASFYKKHGYTIVDKDGMMRLLFKPFTPDALPPEMIRQRDKPAKNQNPGKVTVTYYLTGSCPACSIVYERAKKVAAEFGDRVVMQTVDTMNRETYLRCGNQNCLFIEDRQASYGPPLTAAKIRKRIGKQVRRLSV